MDEDKIEPSGPPPVEKGTPISVKGAGKSEDKSKKPIKITEPEAEEPEKIKPEESTDEPETESEPEAPPIPLTAADKDLQSIDMSDDVDVAEARSKSPHFAPPKKPKRSKKKLIKIFVILLIIAAIAVGAWWFLSRPKNDKAEPPTNQANTSENSNAATQPEVPTIKTYKNDTIKVELSYPSNWKVAEESNQVVLSSPEITYAKKDNTEGKGSFRLIVQKGFNQTDSTTINNAVAVKTSEMVKYTAPAPGQRTESYLSYLGADKQTFTFIMITSGKQYNPGDTVAATLPLTQDSYIVVGGYGKGKGGNIDFDSLSVDKIQQSATVYNQAVEIIKSLKITG